MSEPTVTCKEARSAGYVVTLDDAAYSTVVHCLRQNARADFERAESLKDDPRHTQLAATFIVQARRANHVADVLEGA